jgi:L-histidine N-alpha-methyltransferase
MDERVRFLVRSSHDPLAEDGANVIRGLCQSPKKISSVYVYDRLGTQLFEQQCETPEYYLRRVEIQLLGAHAGEIVDLCGSRAIVELGAGTAEKTRILFSEYERRGEGYDYFPIDVDTETLFSAAHRLVFGFPHLFVHCLGTTYQDGLRALPDLPQGKLFLFLGSTIGNMEADERHTLLTELYRRGSPGDYLLLGADLDKDAAIIDRAYNDAAGYGPQSTLNILSHLNRRYDANFVIDNFRYRSAYNSSAKRNEVSIESLVDQEVTLANLGFAVALARAELIDAEVMRKFDPEELGGILNRAGFAVARRWIEPVFRYGLFLARRP